MSTNEHGKPDADAKAGAEAALARVGNPKAMAEAVALARVGGTCRRWWRQAVGLELDERAVGLLPVLQRACAEWRIRTAALDDGEVELLFRLDRLRLIRLDGLSNEPSVRPSRILGCRFMSPDFAMLTAAILYEADFGGERGSNAYGWSLPLGAPERDAVDPGSREAVRRGAVARVCELEPCVGSDVMSFNGKAVVHVLENGDRLLYSYNTLVAALTPGKGAAEGRLVLYGPYTYTTMRHIREFADQAGISAYAMTKKQLIERFGYKEENGREAR